MQIYSSKDFQKIINNDEISKFNLDNSNKIYKIEDVIFLIKLNSEEKNFLNLFFYISKIIFYLFNKKLYIFKIYKDYNRGKSYLTFYIGQTFKNNLTFNVLDFIKNIIFNMSKKIDDDLKLISYETYSIYNFKNINYLLGINNLIFYNMNLEYNFIIRQRNTKKIKNKKFYEKIFF